MQWAVDAHTELTDKPLPSIVVTYSRRFKGFNANVRYGRGVMEFRLSHQWKDVDEDIQKGLVQHLLCRLYSLKEDTLHVRLYEEFLRQASEYAPRKDSDPFLKERFEVLNEEYFFGMMNQPNLVWGRDSTTKLGSYDYATDTVTLSTIFKDDQDLLDYVLYHELLHKKHKFSCSNGRTHHHTPAFRKDEKQFWLKDAEKKLNRFVAKKRHQKTVGTKRFWPWKRHK